ncbi:DHS-like NAD/FAD-binding domain-containing protein [Suhomyces tanzawaensis NRRL Y-17324]|uniref:NAD-dependent protein deacylase n=1 Tax=Suhomyces tanzawaensis NRRL Y-17324 TaxID=984487 RepID=A0A1E4SD56_9ASCO|nr:DHS-like NAD/FAD-binding domain-containing protein [Suhomyces tanzawaensis NRRL Y-17324]ODV77406.1 DHS-like NAD/FAD-binding domain-containing protein [Suhomyces tanzawaensis NRRL Y-17324]
MKALLEFQDHLQKSRRIVALVGAGLSVSSGLPTYRGTQGLWKNFNMIDLATPDAFYIDPGLVWQFYSWRRFNALKAKPNKGHQAVSQLAQIKGNDYITITQNVDGLQSRSGHPKHNLYEIHGSLFELKCTSFTCNYTDRDNFTNPLTPALADTEYEYDSKRKRRDLDTDQSISPQFRPVKELAELDLPSCPACNELLRPGVVWFGESLLLLVIDQIDNFIEEDHVDLVLVIGTSGTVYPANSYVDRIKLKGGKVAVFNTDIDQDVLEGKVSNTWGFKGDAAETLPLALKPLLEKNPASTTI